MNIDVNKINTVIEKTSIITPRTNDQERNNVIAKI
jgi:hypothetical protein